MAGLLCYLFAHDPTFKRHKQQGQQQGVNGSGSGSALEDGGSSSGGGGGSGGEPLGATLRRLVGEVWGVMKIPTFGIIIIQAGLVRGWMSGAPTLCIACCMQVASQCCLFFLPAGPSQLFMCPGMQLPAVQGIVGSVPYASLIFLTLYFQAR